jgi:hypothetical protein
MSTIKIARKAYRQARQNEQASFANNVVQQMQGAQYSSYQPLVQALAAAQQTYAAALADALNGGKSAVLAKNLAQKELLLRLNALADALERSNDAQLIVNAGFDLAAAPARRNEDNLPQPRVALAVSTGQKGQVRVELAVESPELARMYAIEYSLDNGAQWVNGAYETRRRFLVNGLPNASSLLLRARALGSAHRSSAWSEPVQVAVL